MQATRNGAEMLEDFIEAVKLMQIHPDSNGKVGIVGFCFGGGICNNVAVRVPTLAASAPYYGGAAKPEDAAKINAPLLITLAAFAAFQPVRRRVQVVVDRRFDRARYDQQRTIDSFAGRIRDEVDLTTLRHDLVATTDDAVRPVAADVWLRPSAGTSR